MQQRFHDLPGHRRGEGGALTRDSLERHGHRYGRVLGRARTR